MLTPREVELAEKEKLRKIVDMDQVINSITDIYINSKTILEIIYTMDRYIEYLNLLDSLSQENLAYFLNALKMEEILVTQFVEKQNDKQVVQNMLDPNIRKDSIDYIHSKILKYRLITQKNIICVHQIVLNGSSNSEEDTKTYRSNDSVWVGGWINGKPHIHYMPPWSSKIPEYINRIIEFLNNEEYKKNEIDCFVQPVIIHALIAVLQPFCDGNTRLCRLIQSAQILLNTNECYSKFYNMPILALSREYYSLSCNYRTLIANIARDPSSENWNEWILFNLRNIQSNIVYCTNKIYDNQLDKYR